jgi:pyridoxine 5-phosphate synthase
MTKLSVNINKFATLRNARGGNNPDLIQIAKDIQRFGADGITVHPRPDERHIRYDDVRQLKEIVTTELNIEGNPLEEKFINLVLEVKPTQVTLVPDATNQLTSNHGWNTVEHQDFLKHIIAQFQSENIRVSIFIDPNLDMIKAAQTTGANRIELYTESYAKQFIYDKNKAVESYVQAAELAQTLNLGLNAGHDLDLKNLGFFARQIPNLMEVSIGHALVCDAIYVGLENAVQLYKRCVGS